MVTREDYGITLILEAHDTVELRRRKDWAEPYPEGEHLLVCAEAGDDE